MYYLIDSANKQIVSTHKNRYAASRKADRMCLEYGNYRYYVAFSNPFIN
jgi:hypothetical protein